MIQRIQSVYLLLAGLASAIGFCVSSVRWTQGGDLFARMYYCAARHGDVTMGGPFWGLVVFGALAMALPLAAIFAYTNRKRQMRLARATQLFALLLYPTLYAYAAALNDRILFDCMHKGCEAPSPQAGLGVLFPFLAIVAAQLAHRAIRKDEELIRSADRIR